MKQIRVFIADDHKIVRQGIRKLLEAESDLEVVGEALDGRETVKKVIQLKPDVVLMDIAMSNLNGLEATRQIKKSLPKIKVLILTMHKSEEYVLQSLQAGASGYLLKEAAVEDLVSAIRSVYKLDSFLSPAVSRTVIEAYLSKSKGRKRPSAFEVLTDREREVLQLIAEGHTNQQIADTLFISIKTVEAHRSNIMRKLDIHDITELVKYAIKKGIVDLNT